MLLSYVNGVHTARGHRRSNSMEDTCNMLVCNLSLLRKRVRFCCCWLLVGSKIQEFLCIGLCTHLCVGRQFSAHMVCLWLSHVALRFRYSHQQMANGSIESSFKIQCNKWTPCYCVTADIECNTSMNSAQLPKVIRATGVPTLICFTKSPTEATIPTACIYFLKAKLGKIYNIRK